MSKFAQAMNANAYTWNALSYASPDPSGETSGRLSLFFKGVRGLNVPRLYEYLRDCAKEDLLDTFLLAFHLRDCRGGKGERELGRRAMSWLFINYPVQFRRVMHLLPEYGRWDDLLELFPGALVLTNIEHVRANYLADVPDVKYLQNLQAMQNEAVQLVAKQLQQDRQNMLAGKPCSICAKWTPTEGDSQDRKTGVFKTLAFAMGVSPRSLRKNYNTPLREYLKVVEGYMCSGRWENVDFSKVPSAAMKRLKKAFEKHDPARFSAWRDALKMNDPKVAKVNAKQLHPHELVREMRTKHTADPVCEAQWKVLVDEVRKLGSLKDTVVVVDTSSSMHSPNYVPIDVAVAMGMIISDVVEGAFHGHVITFNTVPKFRVIPDGSAFDRYRTIHSMEWGGSTNLEGTFGLILDRARECKLSQEDMPKRLFIVSDMQFNQIDGHGFGKTNWERINEMYRVAGYTRPQIVFWNVNGASTDFPVTKGEHGTALVSGFSPAILKALLHGEDYTPVSVMRLALDDSRYNDVRTGYYNTNEPESEYEVVEMAE
jgi:Mg-chelatase subunit ChlD